MFETTAFVSGTPRKGQRRRFTPISSPARNRIETITPPFPPSSAVAAPTTATSVHAATNIAAMLLPVGGGGGGAATAATTAATTTAAATAVSLAPSVGFFQLLLAFVAGGLFFSSTLAAATALYALGKENIQRGWGIITIILERVWKVFCTGLQEARAALRLDGKWQWRDAWNVLKQSLLETRRVAAQGVDAIRAEASLYAAAVGEPGLIPIQYVINRLMPYSLSSALEDALRDTLQNFRDKNVRQMRLQEFNAGTQPPELLSARFYDVGSDVLAFDVTCRWKSDLQAKILVYPRKLLMIPIPVQIKNLAFEGTVRIELCPLRKEAAPGYGAALISLPSRPKSLSLDVRVAGGEITRVPWLRSEVVQAFQKAISDELLWPKRMVVPALSVGSNKMGRAVLSKQELDELAVMDPFLRAEATLSSDRPILKEHLDSLRSSNKGIDPLNVTLEEDTESLTTRVKRQTDGMTSWTSQIRDDAKSVIKSLEQVFRAPFTTTRKMEGS